MPSEMLFKRDSAYIPRVACVHDLCGYGKCSLAVALPVLSAAGCDACSVPTGIFSAQTSFEDFFEFDTTGLLGDYIASWEKIGVEIDAIYSGFLTNTAQIVIIESLYAQYPNAIRVVDPAMADFGSFYPTYTEGLGKAMLRIAARADLLMPNLTEAAILTGRPPDTYWKADTIEDAQVRDIMHGLLDTGAKNVVLKGVRRIAENRISNYVGSANSDEIVHIEDEYRPFTFHGAGDLFASCTVAALMCGRTLQDAASFATDFLHEAMLITERQPDFQRRGISFEPLLGRVSDLLKEKAID